jgi:hypothetical protein
MTTYRISLILARSISLDSRPPLRTLLKTPLWYALSGWRPSHFQPGPCLSQYLSMIYFATLTKKISPTRDLAKKSILGSSSQSIKDDIFSFFYLLFILWNKETPQFHPGISTCLHGAARTDLGSQRLSHRRTDFKKYKQSRHFNIAFLQYKGFYVIKRGNIRFFLWYYFVGNPLS